MASYSAWLGAGERERSFVREGRRRQFVAARALLRIAIGALLDVPPRSVELGGAPGRAPWLLAPAVALPGLSVSHSGPWVSCALSAGTALGLDIEMKDAARDIAALAEQAFDAATCARLAALPDGARVDAFYGAWSAQEAAIKLGVAACGTYALPHGELSVVVCSGEPLAAMPRVSVVDL
nr:4'-phosphopantetheinyl transferase superfamily protein [Pseudoduganella umbonata]